TACMRVWSAIFQEHDVAPCSHCCDGCLDHDIARAGSNAMSVNRRALVTGLSATLLAPRIVRAATITDAAGRAVAIPDKVERIFTAGPPASILLYSMAPDLLLGWTRSHRPEECALL